MHKQLKQILVQFSRKRVLLFVFILSMARPVEHIVCRILKEGKMIELENNTLMHTKNSDTLIISNNGSPLLDNSHSLDSQAYKKYHQAIETNQVIHFTDYWKATLLINLIFDA